MRRRSRELIQAVPSIPLPRMDRARPPAARLRVRRHRTPRSPPRATEGTPMAAEAPARLRAPRSPSHRRRLLRLPHHLRRRSSRHRLRGRLRRLRRRRPHSHLWCRQLQGLFPNRAISSRIRCRRSKGQWTTSSVASAGSGDADEAWPPLARRTRPLRDGAASSAGASLRGRALRRAGARFCADSRSRAELHDLASRILGDAAGEPRNCDAPAAGGSTLATCFVLSTTRAERRSTDSFAIIASRPRSLACRSYGTMASSRTRRTTGSSERVFLRRSRQRPPTESS